MLTNPSEGPNRTRGQQPPLGVGERDIEVRDRRDVEPELLRAWVTVRDGGGEHTQQRGDLPARV
jgi:hypothetical protein